MSTDSRLPPIREVLARFSTKLADTEGFLQKATAHIQQTNEQNRANGLKLQRNEVIQTPTESHGPLAAISAAMATVSVRQTVLCFTSSRRAVATL